MTVTKLSLFAVFCHERWQMVNIKLQGLKKYKTVPQKISGGLFGSFVDICGVFWLYSGDQFVFLSISISLFLSFCHCVFLCFLFCDWQVWGWKACCGVSRPACLLRGVSSLLAIKRKLRLNPASLPRPENNRIYQLCPNNIYNIAILKKRERLIYRMNDFSASSSAPCFPHLCLHSHRCQGRPRDGKKIRKQTAWKKNDNILEKTLKWKWNAGVCTETGWSTQEAAAGWYRTFSGENFTFTFFQVKLSAGNLPKQTLKTYKKMHQSCVWNLISPNPGGSIHPWGARQREWCSQVSFHVPAHKSRDRISWTKNNK